MSEPMNASAADVRPDVSRISPELALVDPELAHRIRRRVPRKIPGKRPPLPSLTLATDPPAADKEPPPS
jgi:hypothetical protein